MAHIGMRRLITSLQYARMVCMLGIFISLWSSHHCVKSEPSLSPERITTKIISKVSLVTRLIQLVHHTRVCELGTILVGRLYHLNFQLRRDFITRVKPSLWNIKGCSFQPNVIRQVSFLNKTKMVQFSSEDITIPQMNVDNRKRKSKLEMLYELCSTCHCHSFRSETSKKRFYQTMWQ